MDTAENSNQIGKNILHWSYRDFRNFPEDLLAHREHVEEIYLKENFIPSIPPWLFEFANLRFIHLGGNLLNSIPDEVCLLANLEFLDVSKNRITALPKTFKFMARLKRFNICDNRIAEISKEIGDMTNLETLDFSKNALSTIPSDLARCQQLNELLFNDNYIRHIPTKVITLPRLEVFEADRCCLQYLPATIGKMLSHVRLFNNTRLTHYPVVYEKFLRLHYDYWSENVVSADQMMVFLPDESKHTMLPRGMSTVHSDSHRVPPRLTELGLRGLYSDQDYYTRVAECLQEGIVPADIHYRIVDGPVAVCGHEYCATPIFSECYFLLLKKNKSSSHIIFSSMFCSLDCTSSWLNTNGTRYHKINWASFL